MDRQSHLAMDKKFFKKKYNNVHAWLDGTFPQHLNHNHWLERHHLEAISKKYGNYTNEYNAAYLHILWDFYFHFRVMFVPPNRETCKLMLESLGAI